MLIYPQDCARIKTEVFQKENGGSNYPSAIHLYILKYFYSQPSFTRVRIPTVSLADHLAKDFFAFIIPDTTGIITAIAKNNVPTDFMVRQFWKEP